MADPTIQSVRVGSKKGLENVGARVYLSSDQNDLTDNTWIKINLNAKTYDLGGNYDATTNFKFVVPVTGLYKISSKVHFKSTSIIANKTYGAAFYINGVIKRASYEHNGSSTDEVAVEASDELYLRADDYIEMYAKAIVGASTVDVLSGEIYTSLLVRLITKEGIRQ